MNLKDKMVFDNSGKTYELIKDGVLWKCYYYNTKDGGRTYDESEVISCFNDGGWERREDLEAPEMRFPFTIEVSDWKYVVDQATQSDKISMKCLGTGKFFNNHITKDLASEFIKQGSWKVVVPPPKKFELTLPITVTDTTKDKYVLTQGTKDGYLNLYSIEQQRHCHLLTNLYSKKQVEEFIQDGEWAVVEEEPKGEFEGFSYTNDDGNLEYVKVCSVDAVKIIYDTCIYKRDIKKLIKALQLADEYLKGN